MLIKSTFVNIFWQVRFWSGSLMVFTATSFGTGHRSLTAKGSGTLKHENLALDDPVGHAPHDGMDSHEASA
jgi:hypothetical protein